MVCDMPNEVYYVYENWTAEHKAVIHESTCGYCNCGMGCHQNLHGNKNGQWIGPFKSLSDADRAAKATTRPFRRHSCVKAGSDS